MNKDQVMRFLSESNNIEDVWDKQSLADAWKAWDYIIKQKKLTMKNVLRTHKILMQHQPLPDEEIGVLRKFDIRIGDRLGFPWYLLNNAVQEWIDDANLPRKAKEIQIEHVLYEHIHPFADGNGRTGRIFMNWQRIKNGLPILIIYEKDKMKYYRWFD
jgi:Fic family protein